MTRVSDIQTHTQARTHARTDSHVTFLNLDIDICGAVWAWVAGVRTCMYVCEHSNV